MKVIIINTETLLAVIKFFYFLLSHSFLQISRLEQTWVTLRQRHTEGAILYEKKLKPFIKNINDGKGEILLYMSCTGHVFARVGHKNVQLRIYFLPPESSVLSNTSFPHIIPVLSLLERGVALGETLEPWESAEVGVDVVMYHLEAARTIAHHGGIYRTNAETKLQGKRGKKNIHYVIHLVISSHECVQSQHH